MTEISSYKTACTVARILDDRKGQNIIILDISKVSVLADYFVIVSAQTNTQVKALTGHVREKIKELFGLIPKGDENDAKNRWNLIDYGDVVVHILHQEDREAYAIEKFWNHAFSIPMETWLKESEEYSDYKKV